MSRVVVTGLGIVSPLGKGVDYNWTQLIAGKSGINKIESFDVSDIPAKVAGQVPRGDKPHEFNPNDYLDLKEQRKVSDFIMYAIAAADEAVKDSGIDLNDEKILDNTGVIVGAGIGGIQQIHDTSKIIEAKGARRVSPFFIPSSLINMGSGHISMKYGFTGPNHSVVTACATGTHAIGDAARIIKYGDAKIMVCGGTESACGRLGMAGFAAARALSTSYNETPETASRPWDEGRDGFVMGEGSGILVLEDYEHAKARGAKIYGEVAGYGMSGDAYHITSPHPEGKGAEKAVRSALNDAGVTPEDIDYINAHGTSTPVGDKAELNTVSRIFSTQKDTLSMSSTKSSIGHLLGAAGSVEAIFSILAINNNLRPATLNLNNPIDNLGIDLTANKVQERETNVVLSNSFGFGGTNASLVMKAV
jgi:3-oxoacyl-[acyl-carrier-protein] synthase II